MQQGDHLVIGQSVVMILFVDRWAGCLFILPSPPLCCVGVVGPSGITVCSRATGQENERMMQSLVDRTDDRAPSADCREVALFTAESHGDRLIGRGSRQKRRRKSEELWTLSGVSIITIV